MEKTSQVSYNYLDKYLTEIRIQGRYSFTLDELRNKFDLPYPALKQNLYRLKTKKEITQVRQGFYVIIPPEYSKQGMLPVYMYLDDLMKSLDKPYYLALLSAAALYGAAHQQPMEYYVIVGNPAPRSIRNKKLRINFLTKSDWPLLGIIQRKTNAGYMNVSSPELTALDSFTYVEKIGLNRITTVLQELSQEMKASVLMKIAKQYPYTAVIQRLGYILDKVLFEEKLAAPLLNILNERKFFPIPLSAQKEKKGEMDSKWKVIKNMDIESDL